MAATRCIKLVGFRIAQVDFGAAASWFQNYCILEAATHISELLCVWWYFNGDISRLFQIYSGSFEHACTRGLLKISGNSFGATRVDLMLNAM